MKCPKIFAALFAVAIPVAAPATPAPDQASVIVRSYKTENQDSDGGSGSSRGSTAFLERIVAQRESGTEIEYDLPPDSTQTDRSKQWQFPARVLRLRDGSLQLLNASELESRLETWLAAGGVARDACGKWIFTWNAFKIECDPQSVISDLESNELDKDNIRLGELYAEPGALGSAPIQSAGNSERGPAFTVTLSLDPDAYRQKEAETAMVVGQITGKPISKEAALQELLSEKMSGTVTLTFDTDLAGKIWRVTKRSSARIDNTTGTWETRRAEERIERMSLDEYVD